MVTMREAVEAYNKRYYGKDLVSTHDIYHLIASGIANFELEDDDIKNRFVLLDKNGLVSRNVGIKAELLSFIYTNALEVIQKSDSESLKELFDLSLYNNFNGKKTSHIPEIKTLLSTYYRNDVYSPEFEDIISDEEIIFYNNKAIELSKRLREKNPEIFSGFIPEYEKLLDLDLKEFAIDNFTMAEKIKLRGANLGTSEYRGR